jgi:hypothetical protein
MHSDAGACAADAQTAAAPAPAALPHDVLVRIFSLLPRGALAVTPGRVCRAWRAGKAEAWAAASKADAGAAVGPQYPPYDGEFDPHLPQWYVRQAFKEASFSVQRSMYMGAVRLGLLDVVADLHAVYPWCVDAACVTAAKYGQISMLQWLWPCARTYRCHWHDERSCAEAAARGGHLNVLVWMLEQGCALGSFELCKYAAAGGHHAALTFLNQQGCPLDEETCNFAAECGQVDVLAWLQQRGLPLSAETYRAAARGGQRDTLAFLHEHGCDRDSEVCIWAAGSGDIATLRWCREQGHYWNEATCATAADRGHASLLRWCREQTPTCPWNDRTTYTAAYNGQLETLQWCVANGCAIDVAACIQATVDHVHLECQEWLETLLPANE